MIDNGERRHKFQWMVGRRDERRVDKYTDARINERNGWVNGTGVGNWLNGNALERRTYGCWYDTPWRRKVNPAIRSLGGFR